MLQVRVAGDRGAPIPARGGELLLTQGHEGAQHGDHAAPVDQPHAVRVLVDAAARTLDVEPHRAELALEIALDLERDAADRGGAREHQGRALGPQAQQGAHDRRPSGSRENPWSRART